jgi:3-oxoacyl-[acyl-carrier-protein] synthase II
MKEGNELTWPQVVMAANAPMMTKAALVDGRTDVGVLPTGQVVVDGGQAYLSTITDEGDRRDGPSRFMQASGSPPARPSPTPPSADGSRARWSAWSTAWSSATPRCGASSTEAPEPVRAKRWVNMLPSTVISQMMKENDFHGPAMSVSAMCASANAGMITAKSWLDSGIATDVILLATDLSGIPRTCALQGPRCGRLDTPPLDGLPPVPGGQPRLRGGEAAVAMVLSNQDDRLLRHGAGRGHDHGRLQPGGRRPGPDRDERCFREALDNSGVDADDVAYINAHGPGTAQCDAAEAKMLDELFPDAAGIFSIKPLVGHCQSAAAAVETWPPSTPSRPASFRHRRQVAPGHPRLVNGLTPRGPVRWSSPPSAWAASTPPSCWENPRAEEELLPSGKG